MPRPAQSTDLNMKAFAILLVMFGNGQKPVSTVSKGSRFTPHDDFSTPTFDGKHNLIKAGRGFQPEMKR